MKVINKQCRVVCRIKRLRIVIDIECVGSQVQGVDSVKAQIWYPLRFWLPQLVQDPNQLCTHNEGSGIWNTALRLIFLQNPMNLVFILNDEFYPMCDKKEDNGREGRFQNWAKFFSPYSISNLSLYRYLAKKEKKHIFWASHFTSLPRSNKLVLGGVLYERNEKYIPSQNQRCNPTQQKPYDWNTALTKK